MSLLAQSPLTKKITEFFANNCRPRSSSVVWRGSRNIARGLKKTFAYYWCSQHIFLPMSYARVFYNGCSCIDGLAGLVGMEDDECAWSVPANIIFRPLGTIVIFSIWFLPIICPSDAPLGLKFVEKVIGCILVECKQVLLLFVLPSVSFLSECSQSRYLLRKFLDESALVEDKRCPLGNAELLQWISQI